MLTPGSQESGRTDGREQSQWYDITTLIPNIRSARQVIYPSFLANFPHILSHPTIHTYRQSNSRQKHAYHIICIISIGIIAVTTTTNPIPLHTPLERRRDLPSDEVSDSGVKKVQMDDASSRKQPQSILKHTTGRLLVLHVALRARYTLETSSRHKPSRTYKQAREHLPSFPPQPILKLHVRIDQGHPIY